MKLLPQTENSLVLRADFSDDAAWKSLCDAIQQPVGEFRAYVDCISDPAFENITVEQLVAVAKQSPYRSFVFVVDHMALTHRESPVLVVDLVDEPGRTFRVIPREMWGVENNLSLANMDFVDFAECVDDDGTFRSFPGA